MISTISVSGLLIGFIPVVIVLILMWKTEQDVKKSSLAISRMLLQLFFVGYFLLYIFETPSPFITVVILIIMTLVATWISLNVTTDKSWLLFAYALLSLVIGGGVVLFIITQGVLQVEPWYNPRYLLPLAGMIFASSMTAISLSLERFEAELEYKTRTQALNRAFKAAMIPVVNSMLAVGVVSLPGMMTGQILSGIEPYIAARYQIMVMCMIFSATGLTVFTFLKLLSSYREPNGA